MQNNIFVDKLNREAKRLKEKETEHLVNPVEFQLMEENEKLRNIQTKDKKIGDDAINLQTYYNQKFTEKELKNEDAKLALKKPESFFDRLRREDNERE